MYNYSNFIRIMALDIYRELIYADRKDFDEKDFNFSCKFKLTFKGFLSTGNKRGYYYFSDDEIGFLFSKPSPLNFD